ncbi:MAG: hypothetical protein C4530_00065 [Desulfobacteraceae bacterium]|nr:MAG: hypothetical protein C4530_00065 [Desulfobacteraceae bacterium]
MSISCKTILLISAGVLLLATGCATLPPEAPPRPKQTPRQTPQVPAPPVQSEEPETTKPVAPGPRAIASLKLTDQAQAFIASKEPDQAIRIIEKAIAIDPANGYNYYFLAEAWLMKGDRKQAREFNRLAGMYLKKDVDGSMKVEKQLERIGE